MHFCTIRTGEGNSVFVWAPTTCMMSQCCQMTVGLGLGMNYFSALNSRHALPAVKKHLNDLKGGSAWLWTAILTLADQTVGFIMQHRSSIHVSIRCYRLWTIRMILHLAACHDHWGSSVPASPLSRHSSSLYVMRLEPIVGADVVATIAWRKSDWRASFASTQPWNPWRLWPHTYHAFWVALSSIHASSLPGSIHKHQLVCGVRAWLVPIVSYQTTWQDYTSRMDTVVHTSRPCDART